MEKAEDLFAGLPPPSSVSEVDQSSQPASEANPEANENGNSAVLPKPIELPKGALKRDNRSVTSQTENNKEAGDTEGSKRVRFKMTVDASTKQVVDAMQKIASHIGNPAKFSKASKLTLQLIQAGSVNMETCDPFFEILRAAMSSPSSCTDPALRADYYELFSAVHDIFDCFNKQQQKQVETWIIRAQVANDLFTDDSFVFSKAAGQIRQEISSLPEASSEDDMVEETMVPSRNDQNGYPNKLEVADQAVQASENQLVDQSQPHTQKEQESDPFGLDALLPKTSRKEEKVKKRREETPSNRKEQDNAERFLRAHRKALMGCLEIAAARYRVPWAQTVIDILVKHAFDNITRFTAQQRDAIEKLWASIREQQMRRRQGKSATGKLDVTAFERLQQRYANEKISIRHAVGGGGERRAQQWLG